MRQEVRNPPSSPPSSPFSSPVKHWSPQWNVAARNRSSPACCRVQISVCPWSHWHVAQLSLVCVPDVRPPLCRLCFRRPCPAYRLCVSLQVDLVCRTATVTQLQPARTANPISQKHHAHLLSLGRIPRVFLLGPSGIYLHRVYHKPVMGSVAENTLDKISDFWNLMIVVMAKTIKTLGGCAQDPTLVVNLWICSLDLLINAKCVVCGEKKPQLLHPQDKIDFCDYCRQNDRL